MYYVDQRNILTEGRIEPNVTITVTKKNGDIATIFSDDSGTNLENPFVTGEDGLSKFYVNKTGQYNITATKGRATQTFNDVYIGDIKYMPNLLNNHGFKIAAPGVVLDATPRDFATGVPLRDGWITAEACTGVTYIDGEISLATGSYYQDVPRAGTDLQYITDFTASIKSANGTPSTTGVSWSIVGDYFRITVSASNVFSVCFNDGDFAASHAVESLFDIYGHHSVTGVADPMSYGATMDGTTDDYEAIQKAIDVALKYKIPLMLRGGDINISKTLTNNGLPIANLTINGSGKRNSVISTNLDIPVMLIGSFNSFNKFTVKQKGTLYTGKGMTTLHNGVQCSESSWNEVDFINFKFGIHLRYSIWLSFKDMKFGNCAAGIRFARNDLFDVDRSNPPAVGAWNAWNNGWFHNVIAMDNVFFQSGEVGIWGCPMALDGGTITTQGQESRGVGGSNLVLPDGYIGTGIVLENGRDDGTYKIQSNITIKEWYAESVEAGGVFETGSTVNIQTAFFQGESKSEYFVKAQKGTTVNVKTASLTDNVNKEYWMANTGSTINLDYDSEAGGSDDGTGYIPTLQRPQKRHFNIAAGNQGDRIHTGMYTQDFTNFIVQWSCNYNGSASVSHAMYNCSVSRYYNKVSEVNTDPSSPSIIDIELEQQSNPTLHEVILVISDVATGNMSNGIVSVSGTVGSGNVEFGGSGYYPTLNGNIA